MSSNLDHARLVDAIERHPKMAAELARGYFLRWCPACRGIFSHRDPAQYGNARTWHVECFQGARYDGPDAVPEAPTLMGAPTDALHHMADILEVAETPCPCAACVTWREKRAAKA